MHGAEAAQRPRREREVCRKCDFSVPNSHVQGLALDMGDADMAEV